MAVPGEVELAALVEPGDGGRELVRLAHVGAAAVEGEVVLEDEIEQAREDDVGARNWTGLASE